MTNTKPAPPMPTVENQLCFSLYRAGHAFTRLYRSVLAELGLTYPQYLAMLVLWEKDGIGIKAMGEKLMLDSGTLTPLLKRLEQAGLIRRERSREDERQVHIRLTPKGEGLREQGRCVPETVGGALHLSRAEAGKLLADLNGLREALLAAAEARG